MPCSRLRVPAPAGLSRPCLLPRFFVCEPLGRMVRPQLRVREGVLSGSAVSSPGSQRLLHFILGQAGLLRRA